MTAGNYQVRERLIDMVGAVSARLGRLLELSPELEDRDRLLVNRLASDIAALQSSVLEAIYSNRVTSPHSLRELHDLETGALVTLDKLETYISATLRPRTPAYASQAAAYQSPLRGAGPRGPGAWDMPFTAGPQARVETWVGQQGTWHQGRPQSGHAELNAWPGTDARYIDVAYEPVVQPAQEPLPHSPTPLVPQDVVGSEFEAYGDALRRAVSSFKVQDGPRTPAPPFRTHDAGQRSAAVVPQQPAVRAMVPVVVSRADAQDIEDADEPSRFAWLRTSPAFTRRAGMVLMGLSAFVVGAWSFASNDRAPKAPPVVLAKVSHRMEPLAPPSTQVPSPKAEAQLAAMPAAALDGAAARAMPLTPGRQRDLFVPVVATMATRDGIEQKVEALKARYPNLVDAGAKTGIEPVIGADGRQWYRAFLLPGRSQTAIRDFCRGIREAGYMQCWAKRLSRPSS